MMGSGGHGWVGMSISRGTRLLDLVPHVLVLRCVAGCRQPARGVIVRVGDEGACAVCAACAAQAG